MRYMICVEFWGPMACFCPPYAKVERMSYPVPTPSAIRGALAAVYVKPAEFHWAVRKIEIMNPIRYISIKRNEVEGRMNGKKSEPVNTDAHRSQRVMMALKDVRYRITAKVIMHPGCSKTEGDIYKQAERRFFKGQCFMQPYLGTRECSCDFAMADMSREPISDSMDLNLMIFDTHVPGDFQKDVPFSPSLYHAVMNNGVIEVPDYNSLEVIKMPVMSLRGGGANA